MKNLLKTCLLSAMIVAGACSSYAQEDEKEGEIKIKITRDKDGKKETFERSYSSEREMNRDEEFRAFMEEYAEDRIKGLDVDFDIDLGDLDKRIRVHSDRLANMPHIMFMDGEDEFVFGGRHMRMLFEDNQKELEEDLNKLEEKLSELDETLQEEILEEVRRITKEHRGSRHARHIRISDLEVDEVSEGEFGKLGKLSDAETLELEEFNLSTIHQNLNIRFRLQEPGELEVTIYNEKEKAIFSKYYENFEGLYRESLSFGRRDDGKYLLEIKQGKKRSIHKITLD